MAFMFGLGHCGEWSNRGNVSHMQKSNVICSGNGRLVVVCRAKGRSQGKSGSKKRSGQSKDVSFFDVNDDDDDELDMTDINTYVSCPNCFNSLMIREADLLPDGKSLNCSKCELSFHASVEILERI
mmetsp:Transcript_3277/g.5750  ORF Transcript_3277/g.5750 Transcript_3277/m.5750 type:complete len:126 (-) Transcript_3277:71-448(-)